MKKSYWFILILLLSAGFFLLELDLAVDSKFVIDDPTSNESGLRRYVQNLNNKHNLQIGLFVGMTIIAFCLLLRNKRD